MNSISGLSILLVEDEFLIAIDAEAMLRDLGASTVEIASTFEAAQKRIAEGRFDALILDVNLNGQLSFPLADVAASRGISVVYSTGYNLHDRPIMGFEGGVCVTKPYTVDSLTAGLTAALASKPKQQSRIA